MAKEITVSGSLTYADNESANESLTVNNFVTSVALKLLSRTKISVGTGETSIPKDQVTSPRWAMFVNRDFTNAIQLKVAASGAVFARLLPGEFALLPLGAGADTPVAIAENAACQLDCFMLQT